MLTINPSETPTPDMHQYLLGSVSPRPIAFVSTISDDGEPNLAPYSFFNCFSSNPPILVFSSNRRVRDNTTKDTLSNVEANSEVVINMVSHAIVRQMTIASMEYPSGVSEFEKAGLTPVKSDLVKPFRVAEAPVQIECKVLEIIALGEEGGAGNLVVCEVLRMHIAEEILDSNGRIDPHKIDLMGRMGRAFYCRASGEAVFPILQPVTQLGIGFDSLPESIRTSEVLTGRQLAELAAVTEIPTADPSDAFFQTADFIAAKSSGQLHQFVQQLIEAGEVEKAWWALLN